MKKVLAVLITALMILSIIPGMALGAELPSYFDSWEDVQAAGITDEAFAKAVFNQISADITDGSYDIDGKTTTEAILGGYTKKINLDYKNIKSLVGINLLSGAIVDLTTNDIEDATPLGTVELRNNPVYLNENPVHKWPAKLPNISTSSTYAIPTSWDSSGAAKYIDNGTAKTQTLYFDVTKASDASTYDDPDWELTNDATKYTATGDVEFKSVPAEKATNATIKVTGDGKSVVDATMKTFYYTTKAGAVVQGNTPVYSYTITDVFYNVLKVEYNLTNKVGFELVKYKEGTQEYVAGAEYGLYSDQACTTLVKTITTGQGPVKVDGLNPGTYYLKETKAAPGYNLNKEVTTINLTGGSYTVDAEGTKTIEGITPDNSTWKNDWQSSEDMSALVLKLQEATVTATAGSGDYSDAVLFIGGPAADTLTVGKFKLALGDGESFIGTVSIDYEGATEPFVIAEGDAAAADISRRINDFVADHLGNLTIIYEGTINGADTTYQTVTVTDKPVTIWVENTTGSSYGTPKYPENAGGEVYICSRTSFDDPEAAEVAGTRSKISSDGADNNSNNRKENYCACGKAADGWFVATDQIKIGVRDSRDNNGQYYVTLQKGTQTVTITDPHTGEKYEIEVTVDWNDDMTQACVFVNPQTFPVDIDIAIPFWTPEPVPATGVSATILAWAMIALAMVYAIISVRKARKEA